MNEKPDSDQGLLGGEKSPSANGTPEKSSSKASPAKGRCGGGSAKKSFRNGLPSPMRMSGRMGAAAGNNRQGESSEAVGHVGHHSEQERSFRTYNPNMIQSGPTAEKAKEANFISPPECPVFRPTLAEFDLNPLVYLEKIRPEAEKFGICKIIPPEGWEPPFSLDTKNLKFTPRVQRIHELEAKTRVKLNFLDQIAKFWELQGYTLKIPLVERRPLDLYSLHRAVQDEGGLEQAFKERKWSKIAVRLGYSQGKNVGTILKGHYEKILYPFDVFVNSDKGHGGEGREGGMGEDGGVDLTGGAEAGEALEAKKKEEDLFDEDEECCDDDEDYEPSGGARTAASKRGPPADEAGSAGGEEGKDYQPHKIESRQMVQPPEEQLTTARRSKRFMTQQYQNQKLIQAASAPLEHRTYTSYNQFLVQKLQLQEKILQQFKGNAGGGGGKRLSGGEAGEEPPKASDPLSKYICLICSRGDNEDKMLLCDGCDDSCHTYCLIPPLVEIPKGDWLCPKCIVEEVSKPMEAFGFEQAHREYTLPEFGEFADQFKANYFKQSPPSEIPPSVVEREFWRIVGSIDEDVTVEYGADLHTIDHGSGFPTRRRNPATKENEKYIDSDWNLNNLPLVDQSVLKYIGGDISGMKIPWMYVGMCFATFCWHNEDHWCYSVNYMHWGDPKTWYGVPGAEAEAFERTMKKAAPELFDSQPDLLHQLVTMMNPNILMADGVPVYRTDQRKGEFVVTFPRAYHAGFNQGFNLAEAVNFAPADWVKIGRECVNHYSQLRRFCVFAHDELVCTMALEADNLNPEIASMCYSDMLSMVESEKTLRKSLLEWGIRRAERETFEVIPDDERQCEFCKTTCFLSAVCCSCTEVQEKYDASGVLQKGYKKICCLRHYRDLCDTCKPSEHVLKYRFTLDELPSMLLKLQERAGRYKRLLKRVKHLLSHTNSHQIKLEVAAGEYNHNSGCEDLPTKKKIRTTTTGGGGGVGLEEEIKV